MNHHCRPICCALLTGIALALAGSAQAAEEPEDELVDLVITLLSDPDKEMRAAGLDQVRAEAKGEAATQRFASQLTKLAPDAQVGLLSALADRGDAAARPAVLDLLRVNEAESVRLAAIQALGSLGQLEDLPTLIKLLAAGSVGEQAAARKSLIRLRRGEVSQAIATRMKQEPPAIHARLIEVLTARRAMETMPEISADAVGDDQQVRAAAMKALAQLARREDIAGMVRGVLKSEPGSERDAAEKYLMLACQRLPEEEERAQPVIESMSSLPESDRLALLPAVGRIGGPAALRIVKTAIAESASERHAVGVRALCNWPDASTAPQLIELATTEKNTQLRGMALAALIRVAPLPDQRSSDDRLELLQTVMGMCTTPAERNQVLSRARAIRMVETLRFVLPYLDQPLYAQTACETVVELAHHRDLREPNKDEFDRALNKVIETSKNATVVDRANRYKRGQTWVRSAK